MLMFSQQEVDDINNTTWIGKTSLSKLSIEGRLATVKFKNKADALAADICSNASNPCTCDDGSAGTSNSARKLSTGCR